MNLFQPLLDFIKNNKSNWKELLAETSYYITIKQCPYKKEDNTLKYPELYMLSYDGIYSDFNDEIVRLCRGNIISIEDPNNPKMICQSFYKFGNIGESFCPEIDWDSALVQQKVDGILIKFFCYKGSWIWVTNNGWDTAVECSMITKLPSKYREPETDKCYRVKNLIEYSFKSIGLNFYIENNLNPDYTYMFELLSPKLRILVDNPKTELIYLGSRNNITTQETTLDEAYEINPDLRKFKAVKYYDLHNIDEVITMCNTFKGDEDEGVVICDKYFNRVKIKCEHYVMLKGYRNALDTTDQKILEGIKNKTIDDALSVFPEMSKRVDEIRSDLGKYKKWIERICHKGRVKYGQIAKNCSDPKEARKEYAAWVATQDPNKKGFYFEGLKDNIDYYALAGKAKYNEIIKAIYGK